MEALVLEAILPELTSFVCEEVIVSIMASRCCAWSKRKWRKVMKYLNRNKSEREQRVLEIIHNAGKRKILDYAIRLNEEKNIKITNI